MVAKLDSTVKFGITWLSIVRHRLDFPPLKILLLHLHYFVRGRVELCHFLPLGNYPRTLSSPQRLHPFLETFPLRETFDLCMWLALLSAKGNIPDG